MPRSRSRSMESISRSATCWLSRYMPHWWNNLSTKVVLPWSTWAIIATFLILSWFITTPVKNKKDAFTHLKFLYNILKNAWLYSRKNKKTRRLMDKEKKRVFQVDSTDGDKPTWHADHPFPLLFSLLQF